MFNAVSAISSALAGVFDFIGLDKWAEGLRSFSDKLSPSIEKVSDEITVLTKRLEGLRSGEIVVKNVYAEILEYIKTSDVLNQVKNYLN